MFDAMLALLTLIVCVLLSLSIYTIWQFSRNKVNEERKAREGHRDALEALSKAMANALERAEQLRHESRITERVAEEYRKKLAELSEREKSLERRKFVRRDADRTQRVQAIQEQDT